ncbi:unnamed protein product [Gongylonema pulchrum]|uniref:CFAP91 domain-containing protein n=1 Tax=Gongylonema pulchrum TaxID=637853 RepID=A0A183EJC2_9BILA|nr:unnamed protein product [Gongylonema pulchrum]
MSSIHPQKKLLPIRSVYQTATRTPVTLPTDLDALGRFNSEREYSPGRLRATEERLPVAPERKRNGDTFTERREEKRVGILGKNEHLAVTEAKYVERIEQRVIQRDDALGRFREGEVTTEREVLRKENVAFGERSALRTAPKGFFILFNISTDLL